MCKTKGFINTSLGVFNNPGTATILADTGALAVPIGNTHLDLSIVVSAEIGSATTTAVDIEHRNAANDGNIETERAYLGPGETIVVPFAATLADQERVRVIVNITPGAGDDIQVLITGKVVEL